MEKIVIVGAGFSGVLIAQYLDKKLREYPDAEITLIDMNDYHTMRTEIHAAACGRGKAHKITYNLKKIFKNYNVRVVNDLALDFDFNEQKVICKNGTYDYDYVVISAGSQPCYFGIPGAEENTLPFWTYDDALKLKERIHDSFKTAAKCKDADERKRLLTFHIVGAGLTGVELAGEMAEYTPILAAKYGVSADEVTVVNLDGAPRAIPNLPSFVAGNVSSKLEALGVKMVFNTKVKEVTKNSITLETSGSETTVPTGTVIWSAGITANDITQKAAAKLPSEKGFRLVENKYLRSTADETVYICGDNMWYIPKGKKAPVLQMVENCEQASKIVANNIAYEITGEGKLKAYKPSLHGCMISLGARQGISYAGIGKFMIPLPSLITQIAKRFINIVYLAPVVGFNQLPFLIAHEFFAKRKY